MFSDKRHLCNFSATSKFSQRKKNQKFMSVKTVLVFGMSLALIDLRGVVGSSQSLLIPQSQKSSSLPYYLKSPSAVSQNSQHTYLLYNPVGLSGKGVEEDDAQNGIDSQPHPPLFYKAVVPRYEVKDNEPVETERVSPTEDRNRVDMAKQLVQELIQRKLLNEAEVDDNRNFMEQKGRIDWDIPSENEPMMSYAQSKAKRYGYKDRLARMTR